ncbi:MAG: bifunctional (p)ppGpp synthetase/guanosine-3',5'-bis(diphosphate) 3'-pyrophosphohydrolase [Alphaproteobacteria bacterium]|nr:bifunctional (p)ppGpp synthetase/guanosine-3',5'-bis(diphosphate) 3'-pyrophosphohydrolase [Alphaproteobacteria bacterium]
MIRQFELVERLKAYDPNADEDLLNRAYVFSMKAHGSQVRLSGDPFFSHPLEVASLLVDLHLDCYSIVTALLHDTVEDTLATLEEIQELFGPEIANLVDGVTKISLLELQSEKTQQAENFRKLVLAMSTDIRVLLVKLADRLHNMRTLHHIPSAEKRQRIARETMDIYVPLSERMGMQSFKDELENLAFAQLNPEARESVESRLKFLHETTENPVENIMQELKEILDSSHIAAQVTGREKTPYSIWVKMQSKNIAFEQLSDIMAFRIAVDSVEQCYQVLGVIHRNYSVVPGRFKDFISTPKPNEYQSLHTTVIGPLNHRIEVQIRTHEMHRIAEFGVAAHWQYKQGDTHDGGQYDWLRTLLEIMEHATGPEEFLEYTKLEMFRDQVFCFTPKGDLISLPRGASSIDFAYAVHSAVGDHTVSVKINGRQMPLRTILQNGDQVEIITSKTQSPSPTWERYVVTGKARSRIRRFIHSQQRGQFLELGRSILEKGLKNEKKEISDKNLIDAVKCLNYNTIEDLYISIGEGIHTVSDIIAVVYPDDKPSSPVVPPKKVKAASPSSTAISIKGLIEGMTVHYAACCHPLPGDAITGIVTEGKGVTIHTQDCEDLSKFSDTERIVEIAWEDDLTQKNRHAGRLKITFLNIPGSLASVSTTISTQGANISNIKVANRTVDFWDVLIDVEVKNVTHLKSVIASLRALSIINSVERV